MTTIAALADDMALIAKQIGPASSASIKGAAGILIDDAAVMPQYLEGKASERELPIISKIAKGSIINKAIMIVPVIGVAALMPWLIPPVMIAGGAFLAYEGIHSFIDKFGIGSHDDDHEVGARTEAELVSDAVKTDTVLSLEIMIMTIAGLAAMPIIGQFAVLGLVGAITTAGVYGVVAGIVKMDDLGFSIKNKFPDNKFMQTLGSGLINGMPKVMNSLSWLGAGAMLTVGGGLLLHYIPAVSALASTAGALVAPTLSVVPGLLATATFLAPAIPGALLGIGAVLAYDKLLKPLFSKIFSKDNDIEISNNIKDNSDKSANLVEDDLKNDNLPSNDLDINNIIKKVSDESPNIIGTHAAAILNYPKINGQGLLHTLDQALTEDSHETVKFDALGLKSLTPIDSENSENITNSLNEMRDGRLSESKVFSLSEKFENCVVNVFSKKDENKI